MNLKFLLITLAVLVSLLSCTSQTPPGKPTSETQGRKTYAFRQTPLTNPEKAAGAVYAAYNALHKNGPIIPGLHQGAVPQGLAYDPKKNLMFISNYMFNGNPSSLSVISMENGAFVKVLPLENPDGTPHMGHVGGLAVSKKNLWVASGKGVYRISLAAVYTTDNEKPLTLEQFIPTAAKGSFAAYSEGMLWVGEFTSRDGSYSTPQSHHVKTPSGEVHHAWMAGYSLNPETDRIQSKTVIGGKIYPDYIVSLPDEVQGAAFFKNFLVLSLSYGRRNSSRLVLYKNPLHKQSTERIKLPEGKKIPLTLLDRADQIRTLTAPPMTEGITNDNGTLAVLFESGSVKYRSTGLFPQDRIQFLPPDLTAKQKNQ